MPQFKMYMSTSLFHVDQGNSNVYVLSIKLSESLSCPESWSNSAHIIAHTYNPKLFEF